MAAAAGEFAGAHEFLRTRQSSHATVAVCRVAVIHASTVNSAVLTVTKLTDQSFHAVSVKAGRGMITDLIKVDPEVVVIDFDSVGSWTLRICRDVRDALATRVVVVACESAPTDDVVIAVLDGGADDFVDSTLSTSVLLARLRVAARARPTQPREHNAVQVGDVVIDFDAHLVHIDGVPTRLAPLHFVLLEALALEPNTAVRIEDLMVRIWGPEADGLHPRRLRTAVSLLRKTLGFGPRLPTIETVHNVGYRLTLDPRGHAATATPISVA
jgi:two-component system phosphate regulon response regulator PhoB